MIKAAFGYPILGLALFFAFIGVMLMAFAHNILGNERMTKMGMGDWDNPEADMGR